MEKTKAIALLSGGLDSLLAIKLLQEQGIEVIGLNFSSPFFSGEKAIAAAKQLKIKLVTVDLGKDKDFQGYMKMLKKPKHGYGSAINPCIDCHAFMLKKAKALMKKFKARFIVTGEVLNERPMSQHLGALKIVEEESGLKGKLLRPLSAKLLEETGAEKQGLVDRNKLLDIQGRNRKPQMELAQKYKISYPTPGGGCLLCEKEFAKRLGDLLKHNKKIEARDAELLKLGRHFRFEGVKMIVGRNEQENKKLKELSKNSFIFEVKDFSGPITLLEGRQNKLAIEKAAALTAAYSDARNEKIVMVNYGKGKLNKSLKISPLNLNEIEKMRVK
jgi:tRNA U34 2-thiouridine synthase MnmA/TrmU